ncbi:hypothetical protein M427DRAFT_250803 [Gonapodya prolifera JEL478]|uniref:Uncharacterized protein n=1 Tax=Gonapodya prolifera (strain JEL478) TaxID=1344416 RepID=A0A138ZXX9_GONPJ|nr:hypothetical protein M427DRAFT_250803 [Gonapodya prolifera JEL478]|eukprot:KXS09135.1 hypothetical protein M427DRAFT_250803 [Gonapodya prolifera JEL478]
MERETSEETCTTAFPHLPKKFRSSSKFGDCSGLRQTLPALTTVQNPKRHSFCPSTTTERWKPLFGLLGFWLGKLEVQKEVIRARRDELVLVLSSPKRNAFSPRSASTCAITFASHGMLPVEAFHKYSSQVASDVYCKQMESGKWTRWTRQARPRFLFSPKRCKRAAKFDNLLLFPASKLRFQHRLLKEHRHITHIPPLIK